LQLYEQRKGYHTYQTGILWVSVARSGNTRQKFINSVLENSFAVQQLGFLMWDSTYLIF
jgi:hypothetical protein